MMGDDGEKFGAWPTTWEHCWGEGRWVERFFEALEANADWLTTDHAVGLAGRAPADRAGLRPDRLVRRDGRVGAPGRREPRVRGGAPRAPGGRARPEARWLRGAFWRNFQVKYREINDLHKQMLRTSDEGRGDAAGPDARPARSTTSTAASRTTATGTACSAGSTSATCALATLRAPDRRRGPGRHRGRGARRGASAATSTWTAGTRSGSPTAGQVVTVDLTRARASARWDIRAVRHALAGGPPPPARGVPRDPARPRGAPGGRDRGAEGGDAGGAPASIHDIVTTKEPGPRRPAPLRPVRAPLRPRPAPRAATPTPLTWATGEAVELGDFVDGAFEIERSATGRLVATRSGSVTTPDGPAPIRGGQGARARRRPAVADPRPGGHASRTGPTARSRRGSGSSGR